MYACRHILKLLAPLYAACSGQPEWPWTTKATQLGIQATTKCFCSRTFRASKYRYMPTLMTTRDYYTYVYAARYLALLLSTLMYLYVYMRLHIRCWRNLRRWKPIRIEFCVSLYLVSACVQSIISICVQIHWQVLKHNCLRRTMEYVQWYSTSHCIGVVACVKFEVVCNTILQC